MSGMDSLTKVYNYASLIEDAELENTPSNDVINAYKALLHKTVVSKDNNDQTLCIAAQLVTKHFMKFHRSVGKQALTNLFALCHNNVSDAVRIHTMRALLSLCKEQAPNPDFCHLYVPFIVDQVRLINGKENSMCVTRHLNTFLKTIEQIAQQYEKSKGFEGLGGKEELEGALEAGKGKENIINIKESPIERQEMEKAIDEEKEKEDKGAVQKEEEVAAVVADVVEAEEITKEVEAVDVVDVGEGERAGRKGPEESATGRERESQKSLYDHRSTKYDRESNNRYSRERESHKYERSRDRERDRDTKHRRSRERERDSHHSRERKYNDEYHGKTKGGGDFLEGGIGRSTGAGAGDDGQQHKENARDDGITEGGVAIANQRNPHTAVPTGTNQLACHQTPYIFIGNLWPTIQKSDLCDFFAPIESMEESAIQIHFLYGPPSRRPAGKEDIPSHAFVCFRTKENAKLGIDLCVREKEYIYGHKIQNVNYARGPAVTAIHVSIDYTWDDKVQSSETINVSEFNKKAYQTFTSYGRIENDDPQMFSTGNENVYMKYNDIEAARRVIRLMGNPGFYLHGIPVRVVYDADAQQNHEEYVRKAIEKRKGGGGYGASYTGRRNNTMRRKDKSSRSRSRSHPRTAVRSTRRFTRSRSRSPAPYNGREREKERDRERDVYLRDRHSRAGGYRHRSRSRSPSPSRTHTHTHNRSRSRSITRTRPSSSSVAVPNDSYVPSNSNSNRYNKPYDDRLLSPRSPRSSRSPVRPPAISHSHSHTHSQREYYRSDLTAPADASAALPISPNRSTRPSHSSRYEDDYHVSRGGTGAPPTTRERGDDYPSYRNKPKYVEGEMEGRYSSRRARGSSREKHVFNEGMEGTYKGRYKGERTSRLDDMLDEKYVENEKL